MAVIERHYYPEPTLAKFHESDAFIRGIMGPIGSGKSVACCLEIIRRSQRQIPNAAGVRRSRWAIVRNTYGELRSTTIKTWQEWVPEIACPLVYDAPIRGVFKTKLPDKTTIELEILFIALDRPDHVRKLLSLELTGAWLNEAREIPKSILDGISGRVGRFPSKIDGGFAWSGVIMDTNPPDDDHWWYRLAEEETPQGWHFFHQPPAILFDEKINEYSPNPAAENVNNHTLGYAYWMRQVHGKQREWIKVYLEGRYGSVKDGKPVYPEYNDDIHCAKVNLTPITSTPLILGFDFGLTPACVFGQCSKRGALMILDELVSEGMGIRQFLRLAVIPHLNQNFKGIRIEVTCDPAGLSRSQTDEKTCLDELRAVGFDPQIAFTNSFIPRREAVAGFLNRLVDGKPAFQVSPKCKSIRRGFLGGYKYARVQVSGDERYRDEPEKNQYSHPHDGLQYLALHVQGRPLDNSDRSGYYQNNDNESVNNSPIEIPIAGSM